MTAPPDFHFSYPCFAPPEGTGGALALWGLFPKWKWFVSELSGISGQFTSAPGSIKPPSVRYCTGGGFLLLNKTACVGAFTLVAYRLFLF